MQPLKVENLVKTYQRGKAAEVPAVKSVSFTVNEGEIFGLLGPNGAGKTSIISTITTLESPTSGHVQVFGEDVTKNPGFTKKQLGIVPQEIVTQGFFNLVEILQFHSGYYGIWKNQERIDFLLNRLGLWEHRKKLVKQLSGGMKRRLMIAKALVHSPRLLLLDEPTAGVDIELRTSLWEFVLELKKQGISVLLTTHYLQEAEELCDRVGIIDRGELKFCGETQGIINKLTQRTVELFFMNGHQLQVNSPYFVSQKGQAYEFSIPHDLSVGQLMSQLQVNASDLQDIKTREGTLEEAFLSVLSKGAHP